MLKVAIVGCGGISRSHLNSWKQIPEAKIVGACDVEHPKPAPDVILRGMELLGSAPQETAYIGDTPIDAEAARRAGVHFIAVPTSNTEETLRAAGAKTICPSLRDLPGMILGGERKAAEQ